MKIWLLFVLTFAFQRVSSQKLHPDDLDFLPHELVKDSVLITNASGEIFMLYDGAPCKTSVPERDSVDIHLYLDELPLYREGKLKAGTPIICDGKMVGRCITDLHIGGTVRRDGGIERGELSGTMPLHNIYSWSVPERAWEDWVKSHRSGLNKAAVDSFITRFQLGESSPWVDDFSARVRIHSDEYQKMFRLFALVFYKGKLIGIVHSRHIQLTEMDKALVEGFDVHFVPGISKDVMKRFEKAFKIYFANVF